jgi:hypothetical protein
MGNMIMETIMGGSGINRIHITPIVQVREIIKEILRNR